LQGYAVAARLETRYAAAKKPFGASDVEGKSWQHGELSPTEPAGTGIGQELGDASLMIAALAVLCIGPFMRGRELDETCSLL
jgi:hypothetical protein